MPPFHFWKMHGLGNDFILLDTTSYPCAMSKDLCIALAQRNTGIGCDQLIVLQSPQDPNADIAMIIYNQNGTLAQACGNATRCVACFLCDQRAPKTQFLIETAAGLLEVSRVSPSLDDPETPLFNVVMPSPRFHWLDIPLSENYDLKVLHHPLYGIPQIVTVGNPHLVYLFKNYPCVIDDSLKIFSQMLETHPFFPQSINVSFARYTGPHNIELRVWERGAGFTQACGTAACASAVLGIHNGNLQSPVTVHMPGGDLMIDYESNILQMLGPANPVFKGILDNRFAHLIPKKKESP